MILDVPYKNPEDARQRSRRHYEANKADYKARSLQYGRKQRALLRSIVQAAKDVPCTDCGIQYPYYVMQFDHTGDKNFTIGVYARQALGAQRLIEEIAKCEVVCANCHAERTYQRRQSADGAQRLADDEDASF